jgi:glycerophosphoryl diester phosphodiesterase
MLVIGHRGSPFKAPENTISSLKRAKDDGADMAEVDLRKTKDDEIVLFHDKTLYRTHDISASVKDLSLEEMRQAGDRVGHPISTLSELLLKADMDVILDVKEPGMEKEIVKAANDFSHKVIISSSNLFVLKKIRALDGKARLGLIINPRLGYFIFGITLKAARNLKLFSVHPYHRLINEKNAASLKKQDLMIFPWTVNDLKEYERVKRLGADGVITDHPNLIKSHL